MADVGVDAQPSPCYPALSSTHRIRMLHLAPGSGEELITGKLECIDHESNGPAYEALSYEWGSSEKEHTIHLEDGLSVRITKSLHQALQDLRYEGASLGSRIIWADGVCINQDDVNERQQQVSIMGSIFRNASRVVTYTGPETRDSSLSIDFAHRLWVYCVAQGDVHNPQLHMMGEIIETGFPPLIDPCWKALKMLVLRGWAGRSWCAQEFLLNRNLILMCGRREIEEWYLLPGIVQEVFNRTLPSFLLPNVDEDPNSLRECLAMLFRLRSGNKRFTLLELLQRLHPLQATDPRDKVYSVLNLATDREDLSLSVDYICSAEELYTVVAARIVSCSLSLDILYSCLSTKSFSLPSWVPDWSTWKFGIHGTLVDLCYSTCADSSPHLQVDASGSELNVAGCLVDKLVELSDGVGQYYIGNVAQPNHPGRPAWLVKQTKRVMQLQPYPNGTPAIEVLWRTLIGNMTFYEEEADGAYAHYFYAHLNLNDDSSTTARDMAREYRVTARRRSRYRCLGTTEKGYFGAVPDTARPGDWVCMLEGCRLLFVVREAGGGFSLLGPAYVHGLMNGEVFQMDDYTRRIITLI